MAALVTPLLSWACSIVGIRSGTEQPKYEVVRPLAENVEVRRYAPRLAAEVVAEGDEEAARSAAFRRLAAFIFGGNTTQKSIAMTAPVAESAKGKSESIAMTAPVATAAAGKRPANPWRCSTIRRGPCPSCAETRWLYP